jgi:hypothetical protein
MFLMLLAAWVLSGLLTALLVTVRPPSDVKWWPLWCVALGPVGLACFAVMVYRRVRR